MISLIAALFAAAAYLVGGTFIIGIVLIVHLIRCNARYNNARGLAPTKMICPNCNSMRVRINSQVDGGNAAGAATAIWGVGIASGNYNIRRSHIGVCKDCGFDFPYITKMDIDREIAVAQGKLTRSKIWFGVYVGLIAMIFIFAKS